MVDTANIGGIGGRTVPVIHPLYVRVTHWINALAVLIMIGSGWQIYNASPLFSFSFPANSLGGWLAGGRFRKLLPISPREVLHDVVAALTGKLRHDDPTRYNAVQRLIYVGILLT